MYRQKVDKAQRVIGNWVYHSTKYLQSRQPSHKLGPKNVGPFPIKRIINLVTIELELPKSLRHIHLIFHCSLLKMEIQSLHPTPPSPSKSLMIEGEQHFEVQDILDSCKNRRKF